MLSQRCMLIDLESSSTMGYNNRDFDMVTFRPAAVYDSARTDYCIDHRYVHIIYRIIVTL